MNNYILDIGRRVTYVVIDTDAHALSLAALRVSMREFPAKDVVIFSDRIDDWQEFSGRVFRVSPFSSIEDYNRVSISRVVEQVETEFALVIHWDGFVLDASQFSPHFLFYDYIGAPWPFLDNYNVGNGGFNCRSRRMLDIVAKYADRRPEGEADDLFMCRRIRGLLEAEFGLNFAPKEIAAHFSVEDVPVRWPTFGFHGLRHLPTVYRNFLTFLGSNLSKRVLLRDRQFFLDKFDAIDPAAAQTLRERIQRENL